MKICWDAKISQNHQYNFDRARNTLNTSKKKTPIYGGLLYFLLSVSS